MKKMAATAAAADNASEFSLKKNCSSRHSGWTNHIENEEELWEVRWIRVPADVGKKEKSGTNRHTGVLFQKVNKNSLVNFGQTKIFHLTRINNSITGMHD
jgi:hypothetical protein